MRYVSIIVSSTLLFISACHPTLDDADRLEQEMNDAKNSTDSETEFGGDTDTDAPVVVPDAGGGVTGEVHFKRYPTDDPFSLIPMEPLAGDLQGLLPAQPAAGNLEYYVVLDTPEGSVRIPEDETLIILLKDPFPLGVLVPHDIFMLVGLLVGVRVRVTMLP